MTFMQAALLTSWLAIVLLTLGMAGLLRQVQQLSGAVMLRDRGGSAGESARVAGVQGLALPPGGPLSALAPQGKPVVAVFVSPGCGSCTAVLEELSDRFAAGGLCAEVVVVSSGPCDESVLPPGARCVSDAMAVLDQLRVPGTPYLMHVEADRTIGAGRLALSRADVGAFLGPLSTDPSTSSVDSSHQMTTEVS